MRRLLPSIALLLSAASGCAGSSDARSIVVITLDTLRADRLGCYGNGAGLSPHLDALCADAVVFEDATAPTPITLPSHATLFTGRYPVRTGVRNNGTFVLPEVETTLAERLRDAGFETAAVIAAFPLAARFGLDQGFDDYDDRLPDVDAPEAGTLPVHFSERSATEITDLALGAWRSLGSSRRFLWVHYFDPHAPYDPPPPYLEGRERYDGEVAYTDAEVGRLLDAVLTDDPDTIVVVAADHGEGLLEHGEKTHGVFLYQSTLHVPLIVRAPGRFAAGTRVADPVSLADVMPTVLGLVGLGPLDGLDGADLAPLVDGSDPPDREIYAETFLPWYDYRLSELRAIRDGSLKLVDGPRPELFDLRQDPAESRNLSGGHPDEATLRDRLADVAAPDSAAAATGRALDAETIARLRSLGYAASAAPLPSGGSGRRDPRTMADYLLRYDRTLGLLSAGRLTEGIAGLRALVAEFPDNTVARHHLSIALFAARRLDEALAVLRELRRREPDFAMAYITEAEVLGALGRPDDSARAYRAAAALDAVGPAAFSDLARMYVSFGRFEEAAAAWAELLEARPDDLEAIGDLIDLRLLRGEGERLETTLRKLAARNPDATGPRLGLAIAARRQQRYRDALEQLAGLLGADPRSSEALLEVGEIQLRLGQHDLARQAFERANRSSPSDRASLGLARALFGLGRADDGDAVLQRALERNPRLAEAYSVRGQHAEHAGDLPAAIAWYRRALELDPAEPLARQALARLAAD